MMKWISGFMSVRKPQPLSFRRPVLETLEDRTLPATSFIQTNLASDVSGIAQLTDSNLHNPWGLAASPNGDFLVANAGSGNVTLYSGGVNGSPLAPVGSAISTPSGLQGEPSAVVYNSTNSFNVNVAGYDGPAPYIVAGLDGSLTAITPTSDGSGYSASLITSGSNAVFTGLAIGSTPSGNLLYAVSFTSGQIDVFNSNFRQIQFGGFSDPNLPAGYSPFNIANINGTLFVTYKSTSTPDVGGVVDRFDTQGNFLSRFADDTTTATATNLNAPWAVVQAPANFGSYGGDILVGNFGDGHINVYGPNGAFQGQLDGQNGQPIVIERLWQLTAGNGTSAGGANTLYFSSGLHTEQDGLIGSLQPVGVSGNSVANQQFVSQLYVDLLGRQADTAGLTYWTNQLNSGTSRTQVTTSIENSPEYFNIEVNNLYIKLLHRGADSSGLSYWSGHLAQGSTIEQVASQIAGSAEYFQSRANSTDAGFLTAIYQDALGRAVDASGQAFFTAALQKGATTTQVATNIFASDEFESDRIQSFYVSFLGRGADASGLNYWVNSMDAHVSDGTVIAEILASDELFGKLGNLPNIPGTQLGTSPTSGGLWY
jgi:uncharacterized protein (TIGR03118 family)